MAGEAHGFLRSLRARGREVKVLASTPRLLGPSG